MLEILVVSWDSFRYYFFQKKPIPDELENKFSAMEHQKKILHKHRMEQFFFVRWNKMEFVQV